jgi:hypothetical protein
MTTRTGATPPDDKTSIPPEGTPPVDLPTDEKLVSQADIANLLKALNSERDARKDQEKLIREQAAQLEQLKGVDPDIHAKLLAESAKRAELDIELAGKVGAIEKSYGEQLKAAKDEQEKQAAKVGLLQKQWAFEKAHSKAGGRGGQFTELAFTKLGHLTKVEPDGSLAIIDEAGAYVLDDGKRVEPATWLKKYKDDELLGYTFAGERGAGTGFTPANGSALAKGVDMHSLSTAELFAQGFGRKTGSR